ncbi:hypothetical protein ES703_17292 [subsurface metagenome]
MAKKLRLLVIFWIIILWLLCFGARAMDWTTANQVTVGWTPVTSLVDGSAIPPGDEILYEVFAVLETGDKSIDRIFIGETNETEYVVTFAEEGCYFIGVRSARVRDVKKISVSGFAWSDDPAAVKNGVTFGVIYFLVPGSVSGMEVKNYDQK